MSATTSHRGSTGPRNRRLSAFSDRRSRLRSRPGSACSATSSCSTSPRGDVLMADPTVTSHQAIVPKVEEGAKVGITLDGRELQVDAGQFLIAAAEDAGVFIPRFCYHPRLKPVR